MCVISGESGAGKTESAKLFMAHVIDVSSGQAGVRTHTTIEERIIKVSTFPLFLLLYPLFLSYFFLSPPLFLSLSPSLSCLLLSIINEMLNFPA